MLLGRSYTTKKEFAQPLHVYYLERAQDIVQYLLYIVHFCRSIRLKHFNLNVSKRHLTPTKRESSVFLHKCPFPQRRSLSHSFARHFSSHPSCTKSVNGSFPKNPKFPMCALLWMLMHFYKYFRTCGLDPVFWQNAAHLHVCVHFHVFLAVISWVGFKSTHGKQKHSWISSFRIPMIKACFCTVDPSGTNCTICSCLRGFKTLDGLGVISNEFIFRYIYIYI